MPRLLWLTVVADDVETVAGLTLRHNACAGRNVLPDHVLSEPRQRLAGKRGEQADPRQLVLRRPGGAWAHSSSG